MAGLRQTPVLASCPIQRTIRRRPGELVSGAGFVRMTTSDRTFHSEVDRILEEFERRRDDGEQQSYAKAAWRQTVHDFRDVARRVIGPTLREIKALARERSDLRPVSVSAVCSR